MLFRIHHSWLLILASLGPVTTGFAALNLSQNTPYEFGGNVNLDTTFENDTGVTLDSGTLDFSSVFFDVANLSWNVARFDLNGDNVVDFADDNLVSQLSPYLGFSVLSTGDVYNKWEGNIGSNGIVSLSASGLGKDEFNNNQGMDTRLTLGNFLVEDPGTSTIVPITLSTTETITDFATAEKDSLNSFTADGFAYEVVPEPASFGWLLGLTTLWLAASRRRV